MAKLLIVYHSRTGGSLQMAEAAFDAATAECETRLMRSRFPNRPIRFPRWMS